VSYNGSGTFNINSAGQPVVTGTVITSTAFNALTSDLATGLTTALTKDGQTTPTANITLGGYKITNLAAGTAAADAVRFDQLTAAATQANQETATSTTTFVSPGRQQYHPSAAKGWAKCATNGTAALAYNVTSVTDVATGRVRINWTVPFSSAEYVGVASAQNDTSLSATTSMFAQIRNVDTTANILAVDIIDANGTAFQDPNYTMAAAFGDQ
tara:strand:- start:423 stop:1061 length:639 start_codon:yes stop_codon:yes gene_type:complete